MVTFVLFKWYELFHYKDIPAIYRITLVFFSYVPILALTKDKFTTFLVCSL